MGVKHGEIRNVDIYNYQEFELYRKKSVVVEKGKADCFLLSTNCSLEKTFAKSKIVVVERVVDL